MADLENLCPQCRTSLAKKAKGDFDTWECPAGHGIGITLTEAWDHLQDDEIHTIWQAAKTGEQSPLKSPALGTPMVAITVVVDDDEVEDNAGTNARPVTLDVATDEQFLWFHVVDFENLPKDLPNPEPSAEELARIQQIADEATDAYVAAVEHRQNSGLAYRFGTREEAALGLTGVLNRLGKTYQNKGDEAYDKPL